MLAGTVAVLGAWQKKCGGLRGERPPRANPIWGRGGVGT
jgi:hypothetical protein